ncbi:centrosomal protein of 290 kDa-like [Vanessa cardui]|uniref:centrosomal protein of 290 kDa-like n=1 Tax=Vanessa cardui TaxID=171605 RepID=UPI001F12A3D4|nr:centrosomal protein of 290 kDa-like [Vanessa cardui]
MADINNLGDTLQNMIAGLSKCKIDFVNVTEECKSLREANVKLELELKETRELEKSHRYHLQASREMMGNLQETVTQLVYLKRDVKKLKDEIVSKEMTLTSMQKDKDNLQQKHDEIIIDLRKSHEKHIDELISINDKKLQQVQYDSDTQIAQYTCVIEELREKLKEVEEEHRDKMNLVVLDYEEKIQRSVAEVAQLQEQLSMQTARTDANIDAYRRKLEELEEKLKQSQFKEYLAQSCSQSQYENKVEHPYSVNANPFNSYSTEYNSMTDSPKPTQSRHQMYTKSSKAPALQVMYTDAKTSNSAKNDKRGHFNITKKRKLYSEKDFLNQ